MTYQKVFYKKKCIEIHEFHVQPKKESLMHSSKAQLKLSYLQSQLIVPYFLKKCQCIYSVLCVEQHEDLTPSDILLI